MAATKYYPQSTASSTPAGLPTGEQSAVLPAAVDIGASTDKRYSALGLSRPVGGAFCGANGTYSTSATTTQQSGFCGYAYFRVAAGSVGAGTWQLAVYGEESNAQANCKYACSIYVWRTGTGVVGYIYDSLTELGTEFPASATYKVASITGAGVTAQNGDYVVVELHAIATQGMATAYTRGGATIDANSTKADTADGGDPTTASGWIESPDALPPYSPTNEADGSSIGSSTVSGVSGASARSDGVATGTGTGTGVAAAFALTTAAATGTGGATGDSAAVFAAVASAAGIASVVGESEFVAPPIFPLHPRRRKLGVLLLR